MKNKSPIVLKFNNLEDKLNFESERDAYYINQMRLIDQGKWFLVWLQEHFTKEGRLLANKYDNYIGGYWIDEDTGYIYADNSVSILSEVPELCIGSVVIKFDTDETFIAKSLDSLVKIN